MSDVPTTPQAPRISLFQQFIQQRDALIQQSMQLQMQFQQTQGAIAACNAMIEKMEQDAKEQMEALAKKVQDDLASKDNHGENVDAKTNRKRKKRST